MEVYWPAAQVPMGGMTPAIASSENPMNLVPTNQREVSAIDPDLPVYVSRP